MAKRTTKRNASGRFERCVAEVSKRRGVASPRGVCAAAGRKKYGAKKFAAMAKAGRKRAKKNRGESTGGYFLLTPTGQDRRVFGYKKTARAAAKAMANQHGKFVSVVSTKTGKSTAVYPDKKNAGFFGLGRKVKKAKRRMGTGYDVMDMDGYPVHSGTNLSKRDALIIAKAARAEGEKVRLVRHRVGGVMFVENKKPKQAGGANRKIRRATKAGATEKAAYKAKESYRRAYLTPGRGLHTNAGARAKTTAKKKPKFKRSRCHCGKYVLAGCPQQHGASFCDIGRPYVAQNRNAGRKPKRKNPLDAAQNVYRKFHGRDADKVLTVDEKMHVHKYLSGIGDLVGLQVLTQDGRAKVTLKFDDGAVLAQNEKRNQLFIRGGDQSVNLKDFGISGPVHELENLGEVISISYYTRKDHLAPEDGGEAIYKHQFGRKKPTLIYDTVNKKMELAGGGYDIPDEGIDR